MTALDAATVGPVDFAVIAFEGDAFNGQVAPAILDLVDAGTVRIIDLAFIRKAADGSTSFVEAVDSEVADHFMALGDDQADLLNDRDLEELAEQLEPATAALVVVWENTWAARLATAIRGSGGTLVAFDRIPHEQVAVAIDALQNA
jgi:hypothetical protein